MQKENIKIFSYGDSQGEVLDYVFYNDDRYIKFEEDNRVGWRSGLSIRGIKKFIENIIYPLLEVESKIDKIIVFLCFGSTDIDWNLSYKRDVKKEYPDTTNYIKEMVSGIEFILNSIRELENFHKDKRIDIVITFPYVPIDLDIYYLKRYNEKNNIPGYYLTIPTEERRYLWEIYKQTVKEMIKLRLYDKGRCHIIDIATEMNVNLKKYNREYEDHHPDFIKTQHLIAKEIRNINIGLNPTCYLKHLYPHIRRTLI